MKYLVSIIFAISTFGSAFANTHNLYECRSEQISCGGQQLELTYSTTSKSGAPGFYYKSGTGSDSLKFEHNQGDEIKVEETTVGTVVSSESSSVARIAILIPKISAPESPKDLRFDTYLFKRTRKGEGIEDLVIPVSCVAKFAIY